MKKIIYIIAMVAIVLGGCKGCKEDKYIIDENLIGEWGVDSVISHTDGLVYHNLDSINGKPAASLAKVGFEIYPDYKLEGYWYHQKIGGQYGILEKGKFDKFSCFIINDFLPRFTTTWQPFCVNILNTASTYEVSNGQLSIKSDLENKTVKLTKY